MRDVRNTYFWDENRKMLTDNETLIPGLRLFGQDKRMNSSGSNRLHYHAEAMEITYVVRECVFLALAVPIIMRLAVRAYDFLKRTA